MSYDSEREAFRAGWWAAWYNTAEGHNGEYTRKSDKGLNEQEDDAYATWRLENR